MNIKKKVFTKTFTVKSKDAVIATFNLPITVTHSSPMSSCMKAASFDISVKYPQRSLDKFLAFVKSLEAELGDVEVLEEK